MPAYKTPWPLEVDGNSRIYPGLVPEAIYRADVVSCPEQGPAKIDIAGSLVQVGYHPGLRRGDRMLLKLVRLWPSVVFKLMIRKNDGLGEIEVNI